MKDLDLERIKQGYGLTRSSLKPTDFLKKERYKMTVRDIQSVYCDELIIYHHTKELYDGYISNIPEELLDKEVIELAASFDSGMECAWIEVYI